MSNSDSLPKPGKLFDASLAVTLESSTETLRRQLGSTAQDAQLWLFLYGAWKLLESGVELEYLHERLLQTWETFETTQEQVGEQ